jgi:peptidase S41-like protein
VNKNKKKYILRLLLSLLPTPNCFAQQPVHAITPVQVDTIIDGLIRSAGDYVFSETAVKLQTSLRYHRAEYRAISDPKVLANRLTEDLRAEGHDHHLQVTFGEELGIQKEPTPEEKQHAHSFDRANGYGINGMSCIVVRSDGQMPKRPFRNDIYWPVCYDAEGSKTLLQDYLYAAELRARGMGSKQVHFEVTRRFGTPPPVAQRGAPHGAYPNPARAGIAYMTAPIMRGFADSNVPDPMTMNLPHYMFYAPNVKDSDIGGKPFSQYPFILSMSPGRDDVIILMVGETEKAKILLESKDLLAELCSYRDFLCTTEATRVRMPKD